ncbi:endogenous retrovirus group 3 member 1 env polyprotein [Limosa lapponica baueri]|uniref:Endogenous retrovirus group 3 member 1 env polyprotein n=1 Tax=Limosa lapponica baueri TaxID=1758121 RepID=A0A2I0TGA0_LIMLA|nr:endogenous retrovirus group 3 member 1 env polyprotein [Limosa lapponica baueri]
MYCVIFWKKIMSALQYQSLQTFVQPLQGQVDELKGQLGQEQAQASCSQSALKEQILADGSRRNPLYSSKELGKAKARLDEATAPLVRPPLVKTEYVFEDDQDMAPQVTTKEVPYSAMELTKLKKEFSRTPRESETQYVWRVPLSGRDQILLSEQEDEGYWGPVVFLTTGNYRAPWSLTQRAAYWAGGLNPLEQDDPFAITGSVDQLMESVQKAACLQMLHNCELRPQQESPMMLPVDPERMTPLIRGLPESLKLTSIQLQGTIRALERVTAATEGKGIVPPDCRNPNQRVWTWGEVVQEFINYGQKYGPVSAPSAKPHSKCLLGLDVLKVLVGGNQIEKVPETQNDIIVHLETLGLKIPPGKVQTPSDEVKFLGIWWKGGMTCIPKDTLTTLDQIKMPKSKKELQHALGLLVFWRKHIPDFSIIARPLHDLLRKGVSWDQTKKLCSF